VRIGIGRFDYDRRGILGATHPRFFTWRSFVGMAYWAGWLVDDRRVTGLPLEILVRDDDAPRKRRVGALPGLRRRVRQPGSDAQFARALLRTGRLRLGTCSSLAQERAAHMLERAGFQAVETAGAVSRYELG
jgi:hypothetical protein